MGSVEKWRRFFEGAEADICSVIEYAILVAASDYPNEFKRRRDKIAERLYTSRLLRCCECDAAVPQPDDHIDDGKNEDDDGINKGSNNTKVTSSSDDADDADRNRVSNYSYDEAEALTEEIEEESEILREVFRIKDILANLDESDSLLIESLRRLELMQLSVEILKATDIGRKVNRLRKHKSKTICSMAKKLVSSWKELADEWMKTAGNVAVAAIAGTSTDSVSPATADDENGLPSPPLEDVAFLATQTTSIEISQFFDGMDDDGNPRIPDTIENYGHEKGEKQHSVQYLPKRKQPENQNYLKRDASHCSKPETVTDRAKNGELRRDAQIQSDTDRHGNLMRGANYIVASSGPGRPPIVSQERKSYEENMQQKPESNKQQIKPSPLPAQHKSSSPEDKSVKVKLEAAKRRLQEGYQQVEKGGSDVCVGATTFTLVNKCKHAVWPGIQPGAGKAVLAKGGLRLLPHRAVSITAPAGWSGRLWGRHGCSFDRTGKGSCVTGDCGSGLFCNGAGGAPPATLAEFTLGTLDFYDVSLVDGYNLPLAIAPRRGTGKCTYAGCISDLNPSCPPDLQVKNKRGEVVACKSACFAFSTPQYCCTGSYGNPQTCRPTSYSRVFKNACPRAYSYAYDDPASLATCSAADYLITFCPH